MVLNASHSPLDMIMLLNHPGVFFGKIFHVSDILVRDVSLFTGTLSISSFVLRQPILFRQRMLCSSNMSVRFLYYLFGAKERFGLMS